MAKYCTKCGTPADDGAAFCQTCGNAFAPPQPVAPQSTNPHAPPQNTAPPPGFPSQRQAPPKARSITRRGLLVGLFFCGAVLILLLSLVVLKLIGEATAESGRPLQAETGAAAESQNTGLPGGTAPPASMPSGSTAPPADFWTLVDQGEAQAYDVYTMYDTTVERDRGRTVLAPGWRFNWNFLWDFQSVLEPVTICSAYMSPDGQAGILSRNGARFVEASNTAHLNLPDPDSIFGLPRHAIMTPEQLIETYAPTMYAGLSDISIQSYAHIDDGGRMQAAYQAALAQDVEATAAAGNRMENLYRQYGVAKGTADIDGQLKEFEIYIVLEGHDVAYPSAGDNVFLRQHGMSGLTMLYAPPGELAGYIPDMAFIIDNSQMNSCWLDARRSIAEYMIARVQSGELTHWADAWLYADAAIANAKSTVPDTQDYSSYRKERIDLEGFQLGAWEPDIQRYRYVSAAGDVFTFGREWAGAWYAGTSLVTCDVPGHVPDEVAGYMALEPEGG